MVEGSYPTLSAAGSASGSRVHIRPGLSARLHPTTGEDMTPGADKMNGCDVCAIKCWTKEGFLGNYGATAGALNPDVSP